jgi:hypothetical protein
MHTNEQSLKKHSKVALTALGILLIAAIILYKERYFADTSYVVFNIINTKHLFIQNQRFGSFITQIVPLLCLKLNLGLTPVLIAYSISFNFFFFFICALIIFRYKQYALSILMALFYLLLVSDSFFLENDELLQGMAWMFLFYSVIFDLAKKQVNFILLAIPFSLLAFLAISSHFLTSIPTVFLWVYFIIEKKNWPFSLKKTMILSLLLGSVVIFKFLLSQTQTYENNHLQGVTHISLRDISDSIRTPVVRMFLYRCLVNYWWAVILLILGLIQLFKDKKNLLAIWTLLSCIGYIILMGITYRLEDFNTRLCHIELEWQSLGIIVATPFVFSFLPKLKPSISIWLLIIIFITRMGYIGTAIPAFRWRIQFQEKVIAQMKKKNITKLALFMDNEFRPKCILDWSLPYETILNSASMRDNPQYTFFLINKDDKQLQESIKTQKGVYNGFNLSNASDFNHKYFSIDTTHPYQIMSYEELFQ